ncbi:hypothetical protein NX773_01295 [Massilia solisilvae]|uniref:Serine kinase n=1 Tax=Massilia solisilvae TaxID=1811225 RepID=A0ABT2BE51_9BURK|nr:hypothetical protein [Massilia solisilvae]MCS0606799.1 hypothetical protein [Massilia solisilvae]
MFYYTAYTLRIASELPMPELRAAGPTDCPDLAIRFGAVPANGLPQAKRLGPYLWVDSDAFCLQVPGVARFLVEQGRSITIERESGIDDESVRLFLLGSAFGAMLFQRGHMVLHGNAIRIGDQVMVCVGPSGAGKSTLAAGFAQRGYEVLADDVVPLNRDGLVLPGFPRVKLWHDVTGHLGIDSTRLDRIRPHIEKFNFPLAHAAEPPALPLRWIYVLGNDNHDDIRLEPIGGMKRFLPLQNNTYRVKFLEGMSFKAEHFRLCSQLAAQARVTQVTRPRKGFQLDGLVDKLIADMAANP